MNIIPWRKRHNIPVSRESSMTTPIAEFRSEMDRLFDRFLRGSWMEPTGWLEEPSWPAGESPPPDDPCCIRNARWHRI